MLSPESKVLIKQLATNSKSNDESSKEITLARYNKQAKDFFWKETNIVHIRKYLYLEMEHYWGRLNNPLMHFHKEFECYFMVQNQGNLPLR